MIIYDDLALEAWTQRIEREREREEERYWYASYFRVFQLLRLLEINPSTYLTQSSSVSPNINRRRRASMAVGPAAKHERGEFSDGTTSTPR